MWPTVDRSTHSIPQWTCFELPLQLSPPEVELWHLCEDYYYVCRVLVTPSLYCLTLLFPPLDFVRLRLEYLDKKIKKVRFVTYPVFERMWGVQCTKFEMSQVNLNKLYFTQLRQLRQVTWRLTSTWRQVTLDLTYLGQLRWREYMIFSHILLSKKGICWVYS